MNTQGLIAGCGLWLLATGAAAAAGDVGRFESAPWGFSTASYYIEGDDGVVLIDAQFLPSAAEKAVAVAEQKTGKRVTHAIVLHANPDKFNGTKVLQDRGIRVLTSTQVAAAIPAVHTKRKRWFAKRYAPDYPAETPAPAVFGPDTRTLEVHGLSLRLHVLGRGTSEAHVVVEHDGHVFVGDLVAAGSHSWLELGDLGAWRARLDEIEALGPRTVHPGRGPSGPAPDLFEAQRAYLDRVEREVKAARAAGLARAAGIERVRAALVAAYPAHRFGAFLRVGLPAVWDHTGR